MDPLNALMHSLGLSSGVIIDNATKAGSLVDELERLTPDRRRLYLDFEGVNLCREGSISIGQLTIPKGASGEPSPVYLLDFVVLPNVLEIKGSCRKSLRSLLEDNGWRKLIFDPRCDSDCLYHKCGKVLLKNVICIQLCEVATDRLGGNYREFVHGLKRVLEQRVPFNAQRTVQEIKDRGVRLFAPELGGSYAVFAERPMLPDIIAYCCVDVAYFELLENLLFTPLPERQKAWVQQHSEKRVHACLAAVSAKGGGREKARAPRFP